jgi:hypothetical protein
VNFLINDNDDITYRIGDDLFEDDEGEGDE